jgi:hypothetical protein
MRWATGLMDRTSRFSTARMLGARPRSGEVRFPPHVEQSGIVANHALAYPQLPNDLDVLFRLLQALHDDLLSSEQTVGRHGDGLKQLTDAMRTLDYPGCQDGSADQFIAGLESVFKQLIFVGDDLTSSMETIVIHGFKLQNLDLATQMLVEVFAEVVTGGGTHSHSGSKLHRLRLACEQALDAE